MIRTRDQPLFAEGGTVVLRGNLCPDGAVLKQTAASPHLCEHTGPAYVFESYQQMHDTIDSMDLPVDKDTVLVMKGCGPKGAPGFPEWGHIPMPKVLLERGVSDCVRISDARMSGTSFGTVVLHVSPESSIGGPLAVVETGDRITLSVAGRNAAPACHGGRDAPARELAQAGRAPLYTRLRQALPGSRHAGASGLRLRFPAKRVKRPQRPAVVLWTNR